ncbi:hypothetical protein PS712_00946 [Pseudomonas fluorescens]|uniref:Uncharacterized protein n=1 Tax=Pseudomonas fluorescens TaxID=294 RepID=A0A5E7AK25_PSEFL|nr:hypothetical protein PS712_00946 [Pseudomonas fluorescens]
MAHRAGMEPVAHARRGRADIFITGEVTRLHAEVASVIGDGHGMPKKVMITFARPHAAVQHDRIADIEFAIDRAERVRGPGLAPRLRIVVADVVCAWHLRIGVNLHALLRGVGIALGVADVGRKPQALTAKIQAQHGHLAVDTLVIPFGITGLFHAIESNAEHVALTKTPADVNGTAELVIGCVAASERGDRLIGRALGHHVDAAADAASRRNAVDQLARAFEDIDAIGHFHIDRISRQDAVQAVVGNIAIEQAEPANGELLVTPARRIGGAHRRIAGDQVAQSTGLLVFHRFAGVSRHAERRFHEILRAQQTLRATARDLATGIRIAMFGIDCTENRSRAQLQARATWHRHQDVGLFAHRLQLQAGVLQQPGKALFHAEITGQAGTAATADQCRIH